MTPRLRPARPTDAGRLGAMMSDAATERPWKPRLHSGAEDIAHAGQMIDAGWVTVAEDDADGALLGFLAREDVYVHALFVAPAAQGTGIGRALMAEAQSHCPTLELWTFEANHGAQRFYERAGFTVVGRSDGSQNDEGLPDIHYRWHAPARDGSESEIRP
ncbi:MAG: GNAT family N-acetyltransferase [Yangia sp.]|nr:GNAT family N-acetyltransferase [Salipiger sp.]